MTLWEIDIYPRPGQPDRLAEAVSSEAGELLANRQLRVAAGRGFLIQGEVDESSLHQLATHLFADLVVESTVLGTVGEPQLEHPPAGVSQQAFLVHVLPRPGVMDPVAQSALRAIADFDIPVAAVRTMRKYWLEGIDEGELQSLCQRVLANDAIEQIVVGPLALEQLQLGMPYHFDLRRIPLREMDDGDLERLSREGQLYLTRLEMQTIQQHFRELGRDPTDAELETLAQTWSEHCSHKTLAGRIAYRDPRGERRFENMLKETIFAATESIRRELGDEDWCVSVFRDNAGIVRFDEQHNVVFKVETHNHPSALEPYGGANTGIGGVIRDPLGTGLGAKPICNTNVFCFAPPDTPSASLPDGVLHPRRVFKGVVAGVRDYGNRMGIPTVNGAIYFDPRYLGNPLVYCGNVGLIPRSKSEKAPREGDWIVAIGGRTGRDGIHGATFSSSELTSQSESLSGGAVQIGNAITEKMLMDVLLEARDRGLYHAVTDCGAGGFSSAVGEMGEDIGAEVWLEKAPLKYEGLSYTEIWISESQERMVLSVGPEQWDGLRAVCQQEGVEATIIGQFVPSGRLRLLYDGEQVADLGMDFLHGGRPPVVREAVYQPPTPSELKRPGNTTGDASFSDVDATQVLLDILSSLNVASKEWVIRQYDHEVQGGSVLKPLVGAENDGPGDAAVVRPVLTSYRGLAVSCGMNPHFGDHDPYHMACSAIDEALRNAVAVGADPRRIALLDNFCWGNTDRPETLGSLVRAAVACHDLAVELQTPFISGKDSLNNEFSYEADGRRQTISIPPSLLISALGQIDDVRRCVSMDLKESNDLLYLIGVTRDELGGSHFALVTAAQGGHVPRVDAALAKCTFIALHAAIQAGLVRACHDLSEGGLAVALAEMAFAGGLGVRVDISAAALEVPPDSQLSRWLITLFSESNTRFLCEVSPDEQAAFETKLAGVPICRVGEVTAQNRLVVHAGEATEAAVIDVEIGRLKEAWQAPLRW